MIERAYVAYCDKCGQKSEPVLDSNITTRKPKNIQEEFRMINEEFNCDGWNTYAKEGIICPACVKEKATATLVELLQPTN